MDTIGSYRILEPLGQGAMGVVYRARHASSERAVALKTVRVPSAKLFESIRREVYALSLIRHPGIVRIIDNGVHQGRPWYAMDLLEGESLRHFGQRIWSPYRAAPAASGLTEGVSNTLALTGSLDADHEPLPASSLQPKGRPPAAGGELHSVVRLIHRVCATLAFLHGEGFINCDLKPENILLVDGEPIIIDFGLAARTFHREELEAQPTSGTLPYMSPEQIRGEFVDARSDLYSIGCLLYELLVGVPPFIGAPRAVRSQHLAIPPVPPSELVKDVPEALERVVLKLLEKDLADRYGHADEVAAELAEIASLRGAQLLQDFPPVRPYLYRPRFVGRGPLLNELAQLRDRAIAGGGSLVVLGGESGVGKTRLAMELTRVLPSSRMQIVMSQVSAVPLDAAGATRTSPLHPLRPFLRALADRCQEGGEEATEQLLGHRRAVLAQYEPLLAQVPAADALAPVMPLSVEASRRRLFSYLAESLAFLAQEQPMLWVLDDFGWADELSLAFVQSLSAEYLEATPLFLLCTYRSEEASDAMATIAGLPHVVHRVLPRLPEEAVGSMVGDMLALRDVPQGFVDFVARQAEGNPFFVAEYLRTAVTERVLYRDRHHSWQLLGTSVPATRDYESLMLPRSLRELIDHRLRRLSPAARQATLAIAVLGREAEIDDLKVVAALSDDTAMGAIDELLKRQVLELPEPGRVRFAHDKLREVAYHGAADEQLTEFHGRAGLRLEIQLLGQADDSRHWATLGHHFAAAGNAEPAARYLKLAADHARANHANELAIRLYAEAINQARQLLLQLTLDSGSWHGILVDLLEASGDVLALVGQREAAREAYEESLARLTEERTATRARIYRKLGKTWETEHAHEQALLRYAVARQALPSDPALASEDERNEWIQVRVDELWVYYWLGRVQEMDSIVTSLQPVVDSYGQRAQRIRFFENQMMVNLRRDRYVVTEQTLGFARSALAACEGRTEAIELPIAQFGYGFALLHHHSLPAAARELEVAVALATRSGDSAQLSRALAYRTLALRMLKQVPEVEANTEKLAEVATIAATRDYLGAARAHQAWLALQRGDMAEAADRAEQALDIWRNLKTYVFPFQWIALLPLLEISLSRGNLEQALSYVDPLLAPSQQHLPGAATDALARAKARFSEADRAGAKSSLDSALEHLGRSKHR
jgi:serine/threonine protein kinase/tetratricopeptide (TPR) repeat protein